MKIYTTLAFLFLFLEILFTLLAILFNSKMFSSFVFVYSLLTIIMAYLASGLEAQK